MKTKPLLQTPNRRRRGALCLGVITGLVAALPSVGHEGDHEKVQAGPNGGRILHGVEPHLEFLVTEDRKVRITAVDDENEAIPIAAQSVRVIGGDRTNPTRLSFEKEGDVLVSDSTVPEGENFPVVVQIKPTPDAKTVLEKFQVNLEDCPTCEYREYACVCDHDHKHEHDE